MSSEVTALDADALERLNILASALSGHSVHVAPTGPGEPAWTDGTVIFVDATACRFDRLAAVVVQASLLAAGSLARDQVRHLHRPAMARRYLAVEGHRALAANERRLPPMLRSLIDRELAVRSDSPQSSLAAAQSRERVGDPPAWFGAIRPRHLAKAITPVAAASGRGAGSEQVPRRPGEPPTELDDHDSGDDSVETYMLSNPAGGGGPLTALFRRLMGAARGRGGGPPGADAPTHRTHMATVGRGNSFTAMAPVTIDQLDVEQRGRKYPEWDVQRQHYRSDWCTVQEVVPRPRDDALPTPSEVTGLRRPLARLGGGLDRSRRQAHGDDIDIDAMVAARLELLAGSASDQAVYVDSLRRRRDLAVLLLLDISGSTAEPGDDGRPIHEHQRTAAAALMIALHDLGDRVALYAFRSQGRSAVHLLPVKRFDERRDALVMRRLAELTPGGYSRLGAAIRHGTGVLRAEAGTSRRLLVVLSDGLAYDHGYERAYGAADGRRALAEARRAGVGCVCLTIGATGDSAALRRVFGAAAHSALPQPDRLSRTIGPLFRSALRSADVRRRVTGYGPRGNRAGAADDAEPLQRTS